eukprot:3977741-Pleurochrysis_carterae.AAC.1
MLTHFNTPLFSSEVSNYNAARARDFVDCASFRAHLAQSQVSGHGMLKRVAGKCIVKEVRLVSHSLPRANNGSHAHELIRAR